MTHGGLSTNWPLIKRGLVCRKWLAKISHPWVLITLYPGARDFRRVGGGTEKEREKEKERQRERETEKERQRERVGT